MYWPLNRPNRLSTKLKLPEKDHAQIQPFYNKHVLEFHSSFLASFLRVQSHPKTCTSFLEWHISVILCIIEIIALYCNLYNLPYENRIVISRIVL